MNLLNLPIPELILGLLHQKRLQRIANLISHVRIGQVKARQHLRLKLQFLRLFSVDNFANKHVNEHNIRGIDEGNILAKEEFCSLILIWGIFFYSELFSNAPEKGWKENNERDGKWVIS